ncbi:MAG: hypothetical protein PHT36_01695 [Patescibacteria group bacterium]|nr:hypothetical protein [Patescibacteria group bacterium]
MLERIIWGIIIMIIGVVAVIYARKIVEFTGTSATLERYLGGGGTYLGLRIFGIFLFFFSLLFIFGAVDSFFSAVGRAIFGG